MLFVYFVVPARTDYCSHDVLVLLSGCAAKPLQDQV